MPKVIVADLSLVEEETGPKVVKADLTAEPEPHMTPQNAPCIFPGETAVLFATGPSLTPEVVDLIRPYHAAEKLRAFGCNDAYRLVDYLDVFYACDGPWWKAHEKEVFATLPPKCHIWTQDKRTADRLYVTFVSGSHKAGLCLQPPNHIHFGSNSGYQQLNLAYHYGIRKFLLVGYNMSAYNGMTHFFGNHPKPLSQTSPYKKFIENFNTIQKEVKDMVVNCTEPSALTAFRKGNLKEELEKL